MVDGLTRRGSPAATRERSGGQTNGEATQVLHVAAVESSEPWCLGGLAAADRLRAGGIAVVVLHSGPEEETASIRRTLHDVDPLTIIVCSRAFGAGPGVPDRDDPAVERAIAWGRTRYAARLDTLIRRQGGAPAGEFACRSHDELVGGGEAMSGFRSRLRQVAEHDVPTLIHGACGTPLEPAARWLHVSSLRGDGPFVPVDCRADPEPQLLVRIFGHVAHAFPGADSAGPAAVAMAAGGTLVLDGVEHASSRVQLRIVELIRDQSWRPIGATSANASAARVVVVLRQPPLQALVAGDLQRDLMELVSGHVVRMPTLADRAEDVPDLVRHHMTQASVRLGRPKPHIDDDTVRLLSSGRWIGHDRELELLCERIVLHGAAGRVNADVIAGWILTGGSDPNRGQLICDGGRTLEDLERTAILATLRHFKGHRRRSAAALGIGVRTLGLKLRRWKDAAIVPETI